MNIQTIIEKYLKQAVNENNCSRGGNIIVMDPSTGDILGMATYPDYNLNTPFEPNTTELQNNWENMSAEDRKSALQKMWRNKSVSDTYEPGSTFKILTAAIALEEGIVTADKSGEFLCIGHQDISGTQINCWRGDNNPHGYQSLREALQNSCNPAFIQLGQKIGAKLFYKYLEAFGLFEKTRVAISGEATSNFHDLEKVGPVELATMSFGQRFNITPLQLITAVSSIANDGVLMQPRIVKQIVNTDTNVSTNIDPVPVRQVLSTETCDIIKDLLESVVTDGTGRYASVDGYSVGGKTGTSEPPSSNTSLGYTASYIAISPVENTKVCVLVTLYGLDKRGNYQGGQVAGPVVSQILKEILSYLEIPSNGTDISTSSTDSSLITVPDIRNRTVTEAENILKAEGFGTQINVTGNKNELIVSDQVPKPGVELQKDSLICLYTSENDVRVSTTVPNLKGMTVAQATNALKSKKLNINIEGTGKVITQTPSYDISVEEGTIVNVTLQEELKDAH